MAQTKRKRRTKHRGTAAGTVTARGRTGRPPSPEENARRPTREQAREARLNTPPTWNGAIKRAAAGRRRSCSCSCCSTSKGNIVAAVLFAVFAFALYVPAGYYLERFLWRPADGQEGAGRLMIDVRMLTVGPVQENCYIVRRPGADRGGHRRPR